MAHLPKHLRTLRETELASGLRAAHAEKRLRTRLRGLMAVAAIPDDWGLYICKCKSVHTFWMRFALDLIWLDAQSNVVKVDRDIKPWRMRNAARACSVLEVNAGQADKFLSCDLNELVRQQRGIVHANLCN